MPLHSRRRRLADLAEREASGESFWVDAFPERARVRVRHLAEGVSSYYSTLAGTARRLILEDEGLNYLQSTGFSASQDFTAYLAKCSDEMMPTVLEAFYEALSDSALQEQGYRGDRDAYIAGVNEILREERISWEFVGGEMTPFSSRELHVEVVEPTLRLLSTPGWQKVEAAYQEALGELAAGNGPDAVTDAGTALQEALKMLGAEGNALGPLVTSAHKKGIILGHDRALLSWVSADRSQVGDAHLVSAASPEDAWLTVHVVGAILLRLSAGTPRPE